MIGIDQLFDWTNMTPQMTLPSGFHVIPTTLGNIIAGSGQLGHNAVKKTTCTAAVLLSEEDSMQQFWSLEGIGITDMDNKEDDEVAYQLFKNTITRNAEGRYEVKWPWRPDQGKPLPSNYGLALGRLRSTIRTLQRTPELLTRYHAIFQEQLRDGIIEKVTESKPAFLHYLPHQPIITPQKHTTKIRIVFDASAKLREGASLNDKLYRGPIFLPQLIGILLRWRTFPTVIVADVEKAFLQVGLNKSDRDVTRFLWVKDPLLPPVGSNLETYRFTRVLFGVVSSPFLLAATVRHHLQQLNTALSAHILENLYVDNTIISAEDTEDAIQKYEEAKRYFDDMKMNLREFSSNNEKFMESLPKGDRQEGDYIKILGIDWDRREDLIVLRTPVLPMAGATKRAILSVIASIYDPCGWMSPITVPIKHFLQELWASRTDWDQTLNEEQERQWALIASEWKPLVITLLRRITMGTLHAFVDASAKAYAVVVYVTGTQGGQIIFAKSRIAPLKSLTIPRLELMACLIGSRALRYLKEEMRIDKSEKCFLWSDNQAVLQWVADDNIRVNRFVQNRLQEIRKLRDDIAIEFRYVPTEDNSADIASRGCTPTELQQSWTWWHGPKWIASGEEVWPKWKAKVCAQMENYEMESQEPTESQGDKQGMSAVLITASVPPVVNWERFSKWSRLKAVMQKVYQFIYRVKKQPISPSTSLAKAERWLIRECQKNRDSTDQRWRLVPDKEGILRCVGRVNALVREEARLIYLPRHAYITKLLIEQAHRDVLHGGVSLTLSKIREKFWFERGRRTVGKIITQCMACKRRRARPFALPPMAPYPIERISRTRPFEHVGLDYFGPFNIRVRSQIEKRWIALFTCFSTRAIHLEIVTDLTAETCLHVFRRFVSRKGFPKSVYSDHGSHLTVVARTLQAALWEASNSEKIKNFLQNKECNWSFTTPHAPWKGGLYERMIGLVKEALRQTIGRKLLTEQNFSTLCLEVEAVVNSRPLTYIDEDPQLILRPVDFLIPHAQVSVPLPVDNSCELEDPSYSGSDNDSYVKLISLWHKTAALVDTFWDLWHRRYLNELREREKRMHNGPRLRVQRQPKKGEVVLVEQEGTTRSCWPMGRIQEVHGTEENIRTATVIMANGRTLQRPISALYPLEISTEAAKRADPNLEEEELEQYVHGNSLVEWGRGRSTDSAQSKRFKLPFLTL